MHVLLNVLYCVLQTINNSNCDPIHYDNKYLILGQFHIFVFLNIPKIYYIYEWSLGDLKLREWVTILLLKGVWCPTKKYWTSIGCSDIYDSKWKWKGEIGHNSQCQNMVEIALKCHHFEYIFDHFQTYPQSHFALPVVFTDYPTDFLNPLLKPTYGRAGLHMFKSSSFINITSILKKD